MDLFYFGHIASVVLVDYFAVLVGVVVGALYAVSHKLDVVGSVACALLTGFGGGILRDILLHDQGYFFMQHPLLILLSVAIAILVFFLAKHLEKVNFALDVVDTFSIALFALAGVSKAWDADVSVVYCVLLGTITAVGGGALASIAIGQTPRIFRSSSYYAIAALAGTIAFCICMVACGSLVLSSFLCVAVCVGLRFASVKLNLRTRAAG